VRIHVVLACLAAAALAAERKSGSPLDRLPAHIERLTWFGERADFSPDNQRVAFMAKSFGDAFVIDLTTRHITCLTCSIPAAAFLRVMHFANGDYLLIGPEKFQDIRTSRHADNELWYLRRSAGARPVRLQQKMSEGAALSKRSLRIAFSETAAQNPQLPKGASQITVAELSLSGGAPALVHRQVVYRRPDNSCTLEAQDFYDNDRRLTFTCYEPKGMASVWSLDLRTGAATNMSQAPGAYNEVKGVFPDGLYTCVEADRQARDFNGLGGFRQIDIWRLRLDGTGKDFTRLTRFNDYEGWKASNPVVSTDGRYMAFQAAKAADEAGVGYGILLFRLR
jgi:hypothetical protein